MATQKKVSVKEMFPDDDDFNSLMDAFDKFQEHADGTDIKKICNESKDFLATLGVNSDFLPFYFMKRMIDRAIEESEKKNKAVEEAKELVEKFEKDDINNIEPIDNDVETEEEPPQESQTEETTYANSETDDHNQD